MSFTREQVGTFKVLAEKALAVLDGWRKPLREQVGLAQATHQDAKQALADFDRRHDFARLAKEREALVDGVDHKADLLARARDRVAKNNEQRAELKGALKSPAATSRHLQQCTDWGLAVFSRDLQAKHDMFRWEP